MRLPPQESPEPTPGAIFSSAFAVDSYGGMAQLWSSGHLRTRHKNMQTRIRYRVRNRKRSSLLWRRTRRLLVSPKFKWVVLALAFVLGSNFNSEIKSDIAKADVIINNGIPEPSTISLMVCGGVVLSFFVRKKQKNP
jgi:hypothetical protein